MAEIPRVIFLHIPKTGGLTLNHIIAKRYRKDEFIHIGTEFPLQKFLELPHHEKMKFKFISGHPVFGLHSQFENHATYITLLRHPVGRAVSHYYYVLRTSDHYLHERVVNNKMTLEEYVLSDMAYEFDNYQTRSISGKYRVPMNSCDETTLDLAKANIER